MQKRTARYWVPLKFEPSDRSTLEVLVVYPDILRGKRIGERWFTPPFEYAISRGKPSVRLNYLEIAEKLKTLGIPPRTMVNLDIAYLVDADILEEAGMI
jgi:hypothetical protein